MTFYIYLLRSPSGKAYAGITKNMRRRRYAHESRARLSDSRHPLYDAMRKYGTKAFSMTEISEHATLAEAQQAEIDTIARLNLRNRHFGYNISTGGEYDGVDGSRLFWESIRKDPERYAEYIAKLSAAQQKRADAGLITADGLVAYNAAKTARERWKLVWRALRCSRRDDSYRRNRKGLPGNGQGELVRAAWVASPPSHKKRHSITTRKNAIKQWAAYTPEQRTTVCEKIASTQASKFANDPVHRVELLARAEKGRANMDRDKQAAAASSGLKKWWADLKADPERYRIYMTARTASLLKTIESK